MTELRRIAISGTSSSVGKSVVEECRRLGLDVIELSRGEVGAGFDLSREIDLEIPGLRAFIHLAWDWNEDIEISHKRNVSNLIPFLDQLASKGCRVTLLSSDSVHSRKSSQYGAIKYALEREFLKRKGSVLRAGFLWGSNLSGILKTLANISDIPLVCAHIQPDPQFNFSNETEVAVQLVKLALDSEGGHIDKLSSNERVSLSEVLHTLRGANVTFFHIPLNIEVALNLGLFFKKMGVPLPFRLDSLRALVQKHPQLETETETAVASACSKLDFLNWISSQRGLGN